MEHKELPQDLQERYAVETVARVGQRKARTGEIFVTVILVSGERYRYQVKDGQYALESTKLIKVDKAVKEADINLPEVGELPLPLAPDALDDPVVSPVTVVMIPVEDESADVLLA